MSSCSSWWFRFQIHNDWSLFTVIWVHICFGVWHLNNFELTFKMILSVCIFDFCIILPLWNTRYGQSSLWFNLHYYLLQSQKNCNLKLICNITTLLFVEFIIVIILPVLLMITNDRWIYRCGIRLNCEYLMNWYHVFYICVVYRNLL